MSYTKGPWVIDFMGSVGHIKSVPADHKPHKTPTPTVVRYDTGYAKQCISEDEQQANARLIAASPEMFELVKAVAHIGIDFGYGPFELDEGYVKSARALIESIEGES